MNIHLLTTLWLFLGIATTAVGQPRPAQAVGPTLDVGIRLQKSIGLYAENGILIQYTSPKLARQRLYVGISYVTSRLGTALGTNAIRQDNYLVSAAWYAKPHWVIRPLARLNVGYFKADYSSEIFNELPRTSVLAQPEVGLCYCPRFPLKVGASVGYNLLTGNGLAGPGTLCPVFVQTSITWNVLKKP
ncbi:hypothetical protein [Fibrella aquatilis]|uniref:Uncharacterized protein n=1 Tax=Fibrella aquatilis TaxID=2817059 RepID=A0A939G9B5_9BACT|nr:hypothetical protein [Fibrella aquatilis]MBO0933014.1 hypothetical protein [Fibrella aquatilis]